MNTEKMALVERLIKDGEISLAEGLLLLETEKEYVYVPATTINNPFIVKDPIYPLDNVRYYGTYGNSCVDLTPRN